MLRILSIADDLSGAAEIAGIGLRYGLSTRLSREPVARCEAGLTVLDTDSRSHSDAEASRTVARFVASLPPDGFDLIYKKTDSAFRGPLLGEVEALMSALHKPAALLLPQNPSRGRTVRAGQYRIDGTPLHQTAFAGDPDHPARSSDVLQLLGASHKHTVSCADPDGAMAQSGITVANAENTQHVLDWARRVSAAILPVGGADFFAANLEALGLKAAQAHQAPLAGNVRLFVCGSASAYSNALAQRCAQEGVHVCPMPGDVFRGGAVSPWAESVVRHLKHDARVLATIDKPVDRSPNASIRLQSALAEMVAQVRVQQVVDHLFLEGGATASAVCRRMDWSDFEVVGELATGVVQLSVVAAHQQRLLIKPGSYSWPDVVWKSSEPSK